MVKGAYSENHENTISEAVRLGQLSSLVLSYKIEDQEYCVLKSFRFNNSQIVKNL